MSPEPHSTPAYMTSGERFRSPSHPAMIEALGRAMWNALTLDGLVVAIIRDYGDPDWTEARRLTGSELEKKLRKISREREHDAAAVTLAVGRAADAYSAARANYRNALAHAFFYTAGVDEGGNYLPGLSHLPRKGDATELGGAEGLLKVAHQIEEAIDPLSEARDVVAWWHTMDRAANA